MAGFAESSEAWAKTWLDLQKQFMDAWTGLAGSEGPWRSGPSPFGFGANPWSDAFEQWSKLFGQAMPAGTKDISGRLFDVGKSYLDMSERFWKSMRGASGAQDWVGDWQRAVQAAATEAAKGFGFPGGGTDPWSGFANLWGLPVNNWQRMATAFSPFPGEMEKALRKLPPDGSEMTHALHQYLSLPPIGYTREWQEQYQEWMQLALEYGHSLQAFAGLLGKVVERALALFGQRLQEKLSKGESFEGLRAVYNLWIDCGEDAYAETVATHEFPRLQAEMINALMRMKRQEQFLVEEVMTALNMPTRQELDTTHKRVYELQEQLRKLQSSLEDLTSNASESAPEAAPAKPAPKKKGGAAKDHS